MSNPGDQLQRLKRQFGLMSHRHDKDELYTVVGSLTPIQKTATHSRQFVSQFEETHLFYFSLFKPVHHRPVDSWIARVKTDINNIKQSGIAPTIRELYAVSEITGRSILLVYENGDKALKALQIEPVIQENDKNELLILLFTYCGEEPCFMRIKGCITDLRDFDVEIVNANHIKCLDKRFRNSFKDLQTSFLLKEKLIQESIGAGTNIFSLCGQLIYGDKEIAVGIKELVTMHVTADDFREVYKQFVDVEAYTPKDEYSAVTAISNEKKKEQKFASLAEKAFKKHLTTWESLTHEDLIAIASVYNIEVYVLTNKDKGEKLFLPISGNYMFVFESPFVFQQISKVLFKGRLQDRECPCLRDRPKLLGNFPIMDDDIDLHRLRKLGKRLYYHTGLFFF